MKSGILVEIALVTFGFKNRQLGMQTVFMGCVLGQTLGLLLLMNDMVQTKVVMLSYSG